MANTKNSSPDLNQDPITGTPGAHPVAAGVGAALGGAAAGVVGGAAAGPVGVVIGAAVGAIAGGLAGKATGEQLDPTVEEAYWRSHYAKRPYYSKDFTFEDYSPAYRYGWEAQSRQTGESFDDVESDLAENWEETKHDARMGWDKARYAVRDAWDRSDSTRRRAK